MAGKATIFLMMVLRSRTLESRVMMVVVLTHISVLTIGTGLASHIVDFISVNQNLLFTLKYFFNYESHLRLISGTSLEGKMKYILTLKSVPFCEH